MKSLTIRKIILASLVITILIFVGYSEKKSEAAEMVVTQTSPCILPTKPAATLEETAWQLFVAATCPSSGGSYPLAFESWTEQFCLINPTKCFPGDTKRRLHGSALAARLTGQSHIGDESGPMTTKQNAAAALLPFVPDNLATNAMFSEEVFINQSEADYINQPLPGHSLRSMKSQITYLQKNNINFPSSAVEIKVDWLPISSLKSPAPFTCDKPSQDIYTEKINGTCYALVGMHISSKLYNNWLWATFEPQFSATNPNRCNPDLYNSCSDPWGSDPPTSTGNKTNITQQLNMLMDKAGLNPAFKNYRLVGVQNGFIKSNKTYLGSSFVEFNAGVLPKQASCITCHSYAQLNVMTKQENKRFGPFPDDPSVGLPTPVQKPWQSQDFSWLLGFIADDGSGNGPSSQSGIKPTNGKTLQTTQVGLIKRDVR